MEVTDGRLACGRTVEQVWESLTREPDEHERDCAYCQDAREGLHDVSALTQEWVENEPEVELRPAAQVKEAIMAVVNTELRLGRRVPIERTDLGVLSVRSATLARIVRDAAESIPGVQPRRTRVHSEDPLTLQVTLSVAVDVLSPHLLAAVRTAVSEALRWELDRDVAIDLIVEDVHHGH